MTSQSLVSQEAYVSKIESFLCFSHQFVSFMKLLNLYLQFVNACTRDFNGFPFQAQECHLTAYVAHPRILSRLVDE